MCFSLNLLICLHRRESLVEGKLVDLGECLWKNLEGGRLDHNVASLQQVEDQLDVEEASSGLGGKMGGQTSHQLSVRDRLAVPDACHDARGCSHSAGHVVRQVLGQTLVGVRVVEAHSVEGQLPGQLLLVGANCAEKLEPSRKVVEVLGQEACECVPIVWSELVRFAEPVDHDHADLRCVDLTLASEVGEWLQNSLDKGGGGICVAGGKGEERLDGRLGLDQLEVGSKLGSLGHLGSNGVDKLWHEAGGRVVRLAEVVGHQVGGEPGQVAARLTLGLDPATLAKAACLNQRQDDRSLASALTCFIYRW